MGKLSKKDLYIIWLSHQKEKNISRRSLLLGAGKSAAATVFFPSILSLLTTPNIAQAAGVFRPLIIFDCDGGGTFSKQVLPVALNGNLLPSYDKLGLPSGFNPSTMVTRQFGAPVPTTSILGRALSGNAANLLPPSNVSVFDGIDDPPPITVGLPNVVASPAVIANLKIINICAPSGDDRGTNQSVASHAAGDLAAKLAFSLPVRSGLSNTNTLSGGRSSPSQVIPGFKPAQANTLQAINGLLSLRQGALSSFSPKQMESMLRLTAKLNESQKDVLSKMTLGNELGTIAQAASVENIKKVAGTEADARVDPTLSTIYGVGASPVTNPVVIAASQVKLIKDGLAPVLVQRLVGFDYHGQGVPVWTARHQDLVNQTVMALNAMAAENKSVMIHWNTDGATSNIFDVAQGDLGTNHTSVIFVLSMSGAPIPRLSQIGYFTDGQIASSMTEVAQGANAQNEGHAVLANLLAFKGVPTSSNLVPTGLDPAVFEKFKMF